MKIKNAIILCSGGLDSATTAHYAKKKLDYNKMIVLFFDYEQRTLSQERSSAKKIARELGSEFIEISVPELANISTSLINKRGKANKITREDLKDSKEESLKYYVPCRNIIFLTYALALAESLEINNKNEIWDILTGFKCEGAEAYPDTTKKFVRKMNSLKNAATSIKGKIISPIINLDKEDIVVLANKLGLKAEDTYSCYIGVENKKEHCGTCLACRLRQEAFYWANIADKTRYKDKMKDYRPAPS
jgi:7-cyano-7-deazaguanine synthase